MGFATGEAPVSPYGPTTADVSQTGCAHGLTVREALEMPPLAGVRVLAGAGGLDRVIERVHVMKDSDALPWVSAHELLLTTGYPLRDMPPWLPTLMTELAARDLSAFAVKLHHYLEALPSGMLAEAEQLDLPLLLLPDTVDFDDVLTQILAEVLRRQTAALERSRQAHDALLSVIVDGGGLRELADTAAEVLDMAVFVTTPHGRVVAQGGDPAQLATWRRSSCFDKSGRFRAECEPDGVQSHASLPGSHAVASIVAAHVDRGRIVAFSAKSDIDDNDVTILKQSAAMAALAVSKQLAVTAVEDKYRGDFLRDVLAGRAGDRDWVIAHADALGWDIDRDVVVVVAQLDPETSPPPATEPTNRSAQERLTTAWQNAMLRRDGFIAVAGFAQEVVALMPAPSNPDAAVLEVARQVSRDMGSSARSFTTGVSRVVADPDGLPSGYEQARRAVHVGRQMNGPGSVAHFDGLGSFRLLCQIQDRSELHCFVEETLHELGAENDPEMAELRHTLKVLLDTNLNVAEAARQLHFHYNTLRYRIGKLERILGPFSTDPELRLDLALALKVFQMRGLR